MELSHSEVADSHSGSYKIPSLLRIKNIHYHFHRNPAVVLPKEWPYGTFYNMIVYDKKSLDSPPNPKLKEEPLSARIFLATLHILRTSYAVVKTLTCTDLQILRKCEIQKFLALIVNSLHMNCYSQTSNSIIK
jgi:hypothetical protein